MHTTIVLVLAALGPGRAADEKSDEKDLRAAVERYYVALGKKDLEGAMVSWSARSPEAAVWRKRLQSIFVKSGPITARDLKVVRLQKVDGGMLVRVRVETTANGPDGKPQMIVLQRTMTFTREDRSWKLVKDEQAEARLARALVEVETEEQRRKLLETDKDLVGPMLVRAHLDLAFDTKDETASRHFASAIEMAQFLDDKWLLGKCYWNRGNWQAGRSRRPSALEDYRRALALFREERAEGSEAGVLYAMGVVHGQAERYKEALRSFEDSLAICRKLHDLGNARENLRNIAIVQVRMGQPSEALQTYREGLKVARQLRDPSILVESLFELARALERVGNDRAAMETYLECLALQRTQKDDSGVLNTLTDLGQTQQRLGDYAAALRRYQEAQELNGRVHDPAAAAVLLNNIGVVHEHMGRYAEALHNYQEALKTAHGAKLRIGLSQYLNNIGNIYEMTGLHAEALQQFEESLKICRELNDQQHAAETLHNLGVVHDGLHHPTDALRHFQMSLDLKRRLGDRSGEALTLMSMGILQRRQEDYPAALETFRTSLKISHELGHRAEEALVLSNIGRVFIESNRPADALPPLEESRKIAEAIGALEVAVHCERYRGLAYRAQHDWRRGADAFRASIGHLEQLRANSREPGLQTSMFAGRVFAHYELIDCLLHLNQTADVFPVSESLRSRTLVDRMRESKVDVRQGMTEQEKSTEQRLQERITSVGRQITELRGRRADADQVAALVREQEKARRELEAFSRTLYLRLPALRTRRAEFVPVSLAEVNRTLLARPGLVVLSYLVGEEYSLLFVLTRGDRADGPARLEVLRLEVGGAELAEAVRRFRETCKKPGVTPSSEDLYRWLLSPVEETLESAKQVVIVPDRALHALPFQALRADADSKYLLERCAISYAPSLTALLQMTRRGEELRKEHGTEASLLAVGIRDFGKREKPLPRAEDEARMIARLFGDSGRSLLGTEATLSRLRADWSKVRYLHFATHGMLNENAPFYSSLVLTGGDKEEGQLFARDLLKEHLHAELAALSACETALGKRFDGEGLQGLSWSWFVAGVPSLVVSQWSVSDEATAKLMAHFWTEIKAGTPRAEALQRAQRMLLKDKKTRHPYYWAPFVLIGDIGR
jgi:CHAT domain-containing protein